MNEATSVLWTALPLVIDENDPRPRSLEREWEQSVYPIGNGKLGATLFGEPQCEHMQFNVDTAWVGNEHNTGAYQPFGDVLIELNHQAYTCYRRELDIRQAIQTISYRSNGVSFKRQAFASRPAGVIVLRLTSDQPGKLSGRVSITNLHHVPVIAEPDTVIMSGDTSRFFYWRFLQDHPDRMLGGREYTSDQNIDLEVEARVRLLHESGSTKIDNNAVVFEKCDTVTLLLAADTSFLADRSKGWNGDHPHNKVTERLAAAAGRSFDDLLAQHIEDYTARFGRVSLELGETDEAILALPTAERVRLYEAQAQAFRMMGRDPDEGEPVKAATMAEREKQYANQTSVGYPCDRALEALFYQYARYLMISSSAPGEDVLPANLQGIWNIAPQPPWRCDFHTDINVQMNYWFTSTSNLLDCFGPLAHWIDSIREVRKEETRRVLGVERGWLMRSENGPFGGSTWHIQKGDSAWLCQNLWDHFTFSQDRDYLERYAYPVMKEISEFWVDHLKEQPDGTLVVPEGRSPEHGPVGVDGVTYDQCLCWDLFNNTVEAASILNVDPEFRSQLTDMRDRLLGPQVGKWGQLQEWMQDIDDPEDDHRHINHMIGVYPGRQIHPTTTPKFAKAAHVGLVARRLHGPGHPGWSRVWKSCLFARLFDAESAFGELVQFMGKCVFGNLWAVHPPFQIDANFGYAAAVNEIMVQSHLQDDHGTYLVDLLPALPKAWGDGRVVGLRVRGGLTLDMTWTKGRLTSATFRNERDVASGCNARYDGQSWSVELAAGESMTFDR